MSRSCYILTLPFLIIGFLTKIGDSENDGYQLKETEERVNSDSGVTTPNHTIYLAVLTDISSSLYATTGMRI